MHFQLPNLNYDDSDFFIYLPGLPHPGKVLDFFFCPGKFLNFVYKSWKKFGKFSRDLPGQNVKFFLLL